jgi:hypothetical protein
MKEIDRRKKGVDVVKENKNVRGQRGVLFISV